MISTRKFLILLVVGCCWAIGCGSSDNDNDDNIDEDNENSKVVIQGDVAWFAGIGDYSGEELTQTEMLTAAAAATSLVAGDEDALSQVPEGDQEEMLSLALAVRPSYSKGPLADCRTRGIEGRTIGLDYSNCNVANGKIFVSREGPVGDKYFVADFQAGFEFRGLNVEGKVELKRRTGENSFDIRIRKEGEFHIGRIHNGKKHRALVLLVGIMRIKDNGYELQILKDAENSRLTGNPSWQDVDIQLGDNSLSLYSSSASSLLFPLNFASCLCPQSGKLEVGGKLEQVPLQFRDQSNGLATALANALAGRNYKDTVMTAFEGFSLDITQSLPGEISYEFGQACGEPTTVIGNLPAIKIPVKPESTVCPLESGKSLMSKVDEILASLSIEPADRTLVSNAIQTYLLSKADQDGCFQLNPSQVIAKVQEKIQAALDWNICKPQD